MEEILKLKKDCEKLLNAQNKFIQRIMIPVEIHQLIEHINEMNDNTSIFSHGFQQKLMLQKVKEASAEIEDCQNQINTQTQNGLVIGNTLEKGDPKAEQYFEAVFKLQQLQAEISQHSNLTDQQKAIIVKNQLEDDISALIRSTLARGKDINRMQAEISQFECERDVLLNNFHESEKKRSSAVKESNPNILSCMERSITQLKSKIRQLGGEPIDKIRRSLAKALSPQQSQQIMKLLQNLMNAAFLNIRSESWIEISAESDQNVEMLTSIGVAERNPKNYWLLRLVLSESLESMNSSSLSYDI